MSLRLLLVEVIDDSVEVEIVSMPIYYVIPALCALTYSTSVLLIKRAIAEGGGISRIFFVINWMQLIIFLPVIAWLPEMRQLDGWQWPALAGTVCFTGTLFVLSAIRSGDVTVQTPLLGTKVIIIALLTYFLGVGPIPFEWWVSAVLVFFAVLIFGLPGLQRHHVSKRSITYALVSSFCFAATEVIIQRRAGEFGEFSFILFMVTVIALESLVLLPLFRRGLGRVKLKTWRWILMGSVLMALQELGIFYTVAFHGRATAVNILYSTRGFWSIILVWVVGHWFASHEKYLGKHVLLIRFMGALLLFSAIVNILKE